MEYLSQDLLNKTILNIDETWLGMADYRRHHWRPYRTNYSIKMKCMQPRISMITAVSSFGDIYVSLTQSNSNQSMMSLFMEHLVAKLHKESSNWRKNTIVTWDGAPYHRSKETKKMLQRLEIPIMQMGPYSYDVAPCELFFAAFSLELG